MSDIRKYINIINEHKQNGKLVESTEDNGLESRWNAAGAEDLAGDIDSAYTEVTETPFSVRGVAMHTREWDKTGVPVLKFFGRTYHTMQDELDRRVGTTKASSLDIPVGSKVVVDYENEQLYAVVDGKFVEADLGGTPYDPYNREIDEDTNGREVNTDIVVFLEKFVDTLNRSENTHLANKFYEAVSTYKHGGKISLEVIQVLDNKLQQTIDQSKRNFIIKVLDVLRPMVKIDESTINDHEDYQNEADQDEFAIDAFMFKSKTSPPNRYTKAGHGDNPLVAEEDEELEINENDILGVAEDLELFLENKKYDYSTSSSWESTKKGETPDSETDEKVEECSDEQSDKGDAKSKINALKVRWKEENPEETWPGYYAAKEKMGISEGIFDTLRNGVKAAHGGYKRAVSRYSTGPLTLTFNGLTLTTDGDETPALLNLLTSNDNAVANFSGTTYQDLAYYLDDLNRFSLNDAEDEIVDSICDRVLQMDTVSENISFADPDYEDFPLQVGNQNKSVAVGRKVSGVNKYGPYAGRELTGNVIRLFPVDYAEIQWDNGYVSNISVKELTVLE